MAELVKKHDTAPRLLVDVGAGFGTFCEEVAKLGLFERIVAVEPSQNLASTCRKKGLEVIESVIEEVQIDEAACITSFELIEHLWWPGEFLRSCGKALQRRGLLILTCPNIKGFDLLTLGALSDNVIPPNHLNYFHPTSLSELLRRCGFEVVEVLTPGKLDAELVRNKILDGVLDVASQPFLRRVLIEQWETVGQEFQAFLANNSLSSHMWVVARKP